MVSSGVYVPIGPVPNPQRVWIGVEQDPIYWWSPEWVECPVGLKMPIASSRAFFTQYCLWR